MTVTVWGAYDLAVLMEGARKGYSLQQLAQGQNSPGVTAADCDLALWAKFGRSTDAALNILNPSIRQVAK